jgi:hypothetical protein
MCYLSFFTVLSIEPPVYSGTIYVFLLPVRVLWVQSVWSFSSTPTCRSPHFLSVFISLSFPEREPSAEYVADPICAHCYLWFVMQGPGSPYHSPVGRGSPLMSPLVGDPAAIQALNLDPSCPNVPEDVYRLAISACSLFSMHNA